MTGRVASLLFAMAFLLPSAITPASAQIVAFGAGNTSGKGVGAAKAFPAQVQAMLKAAGKPTTVRNAGVSSDTTARMLARLDQAVPRGTTLVILEIGDNDYYRDVTADVHEANVAAIQARLKERGLRVLLAEEHIRAALLAGLRQRDDIHLTVEGHRMVAERLLGAL